MARPEKDEMVDGVRVSYLTVGRTPIDWDELLKQIYGSCEPAQITLHDYGKKTYQPFGFKEQLAVYNYCEALKVPAPDKTPTDPSTATSTQTTETMATMATAMPTKTKKNKKEKTKKNTATRVTADLFEYHLCKYNRALYEFNTTIAYIIGFAARAACDLEMVMAWLIDMRNKDGFLDIFKGSYFADKGYLRGMVPGPNIQSNLKQAMQDLSEFRRTTHGLQKMYLPLLQRRKELLEMMDVSSVNVRPEHSALFQAMQRSMISSTHEMESHHRLFLFYIRNTRKALEGCVDWMLRKQNIGFTLPAISADPYITWLARPDADEDAYFWNDQFPDDGKNAEYGGQYVMSREDL